MNAYTQAFWVAMQFLTRLPTPKINTLDDELVGRSGLAYPLVGALIGLLLWGLIQIFPISFITQTPGVAAALLLIVWVAVSGGLHLDGLGDSADAWLGGGNDKQRSLEIMKDPRAGSAAVITICLVLLLKFSTLSYLLSQQEFLGLLLAPLLARSSALALLITTPCARVDGLGASLANHLPRRPALGLILTIGLIIGLSLSAQGMVVLLTIAVAVVLLRRLMVQRIGGATGDTAGALIEIVEAICLLTLCLL